MTLDHAAFVCFELCLIFQVNKDLGHKNHVKLEWQNIPEEKSNMEEKSNANRKCFQRNSCIHIPVSIALLVDYSKVQTLRVMLATFF